jgi:hypothetical protein
VLFRVLLLQGTLREALDKRRLLQPGQALVAPAAVTLLLRDVAAAMLHLHCEGVIHGDLKAANVSTSAAAASCAAGCCLCIARAGCTLWCFVVDDGSLLACAKRQTRFVAVYKIGRLWSAVHFVISNVAPLLCCCLFAFFLCCGV